MQSVHFIGKLFTERQPMSLILMILRLFLYSYYNINFFMKKIFYAFFISFLSFSCNPNEDVINQKIRVCSGDYSTVGILVDINEAVYNEDESVKALSKYSWSSDDFSRILNGNSIPNHEVGTFPNPDNPNAIREQSVSKRFTLCPTLISETGLEGSPLVKKTPLLGRGSFV